MSTVDDFLVGWICTIPTEWVVARAFFDQEYALKVDQPKIKNSYALGRIGKHNVVISSLPSGEYGKSTVSRVAEETMYTFPNLRIALLVGIGGGVPSGMHDIRLGDIAVGSSLGHEGGVYQYNYRRAIRDGRDFQPTAVLEPPPSFIQKAVASLRTSYRSEGHNLENLIDEAFAKVPWMYKKYNRPAPVSDRLYRSNIVHRYPEELCDIRCGDDPSKLISRISRPEYNSQRIHHGVIASSTELMKDAILRDELIGRRDILCFETAASDLMPHFPCLVIRGICDYADSHANDEWHGYAAMVAAAYTKNLLYRIDPNMLAKQSTLANIMDGETDINYRESSPTPAVTFSGHQSSAIQIGQVSGQSLSTITGAQHSDLDPAFQRLSLSPSGDASRVSIIQASSPSQHIPGQHEQQIPTPRTSSSSDSSSRKDQLTKPTARPFRKMNLNSTSHGNGFLVEALYSIGYSRKDVLDLISEKERDSPWIPFEPVDPLPVDIKVEYIIAQAPYNPRIYE
ncbi:hypothetical protein N7456_001082 [Penicillium angulare]|uniref:Nucleoside phosphorylase domain-containing protein n=1 Tax=Penicillium angulare TaxID=116970 RepID=A0A9W9KSV4_9EURO|nr:hypothetical protein N7456_001082 [Penicillium angulare]